MNPSGFYVDPTSCSYNYRVSEGRVGYKIKEEMI